MQSTASCRTIYGPNKYAALYLMFSKFFRTRKAQVSFQYVTLGGTELRDIQSLYFIDVDLAIAAVSFEEDGERFACATTTAKRFSSDGKQPDVREGDIFDFKRTVEGPHMFFVDLEGACALGDFYKQFSKLLLSSALREGDCLFITSYLGRNIGWDKLFSIYDAEFRMLDMTNNEQKRQCYRRSHPSFTLFRALKEADLLDELFLNCFGCIEYRDKSPMAIYGYTLDAGRTRFCEFVLNTPYFQISKALFE